MPWPAEEPTGENPPDGAIINYYLKAPASGPVVLEVARASDGRVVRRHSSEDPVTPIPDPASAPVPIYWYRPPQPLPTTAGMHRFIWDVHYQPLADAGAGGRGGLPIQAIPHRTAPAPTTPWVTPGSYIVRLTANGKTLTQPLVVKQDPRVTTPATVMQNVYTLTDAMYFGAIEAQEAATALARMRADATKRREQATGSAAQALDAFIKEAAALEGTRAIAGEGGRGGRGGGGAPAPAPDTLWGVRAALAGLMNSMQAADVAPTDNTLAAVTAARANAAKVMARWTALRQKGLPSL
jgi:hypothetical protein